MMMIMTLASSIPLALPVVHTVGPKDAASLAPAAQSLACAPPTSVPLFPGPFSTLLPPGGLVQKAGRKNQ